MCEWRSVCGVSGVLRVSGGVCVWVCVCDVWL